jgi:uncharacterized protein YpuA (DUF1002 family)
MELSSKVEKSLEKLQGLLYEVKYQFSEQNLDSAIEVAEELYHSTDCNCGYNLKSDLNYIKEEGKVSSYGKKEIDEHYRELVDFFDTYEKLDNDYNHKCNISLTAIKMLCKELFDRIETSDTLEEFEDEYDSFTEEINTLIEEFNDNLDED